MRPEHVAANKLVDIALTGDRQAYKDRLAELKQEFRPVMCETITRLAAMQYRMETRDNRYTGWRADWLEAQK